MIFKSKMVKEDYTIMIEKNSHSQKTPDNETPMQRKEDQRTLCCLALTGPIN